MGKCSSAKFENGRTTDGHPFTFGVHSYGNCFCKLSRRTLSGNSRINEDWRERKFSGTAFSGAFAGETPDSFFLMMTPSRAVALVSRTAPFHKA